MRLIRGKKCIKEIQLKDSSLMKAKIDIYEFNGNICFILRIRTHNFVIGHTKPKAPDPIRTPKLSGLRHG